MFGDHYRRIREDVIIDAMYLGGWLYDTDEEKARRLIRQIIDDCITFGLGVRHSDGQRFFDPVEVLNFIKWIDLQEEAAFWTQHYVGTARRLVEDLSVLGDRADFRVEFSRTFHLREAKPAARLRMPLPLITDRLHDLSATPHETEGCTAKYSMDRGRMEARFGPVEVGERTIGATLRFQVSPPPPPARLRLTEEENQLYLKDKEGLIVVSERVHALARTLRRAGDASWDTVGNFWNHILDTLSCGAIHYDQVWTDAPCDWVLETGWFDCQLGAALLVALCRASAIPARLVSGHFLYTRSPTIHYWAEIWIDGQGWKPADLLAWDLSRGGRDKQWRSTFFGSLEHRLITQVMPLAFTGSIGINIPKEFIVLQTARPNGADIALMSTDGTASYTDHISIEHPPV
jgi:hypothetical protein